MVESRFRWVTLHRALDLIENYPKSKVISFIEEIGCGHDADQLSSAERTTPGLRNLISRLCREDPPRLDTEGLLLVNRVVQEAASCVPTPEPPRPWDRKPQTPQQSVTAFLNSLAVDGWCVERGQLVPITLVPIAESRSRVRRALEDWGADEALKRLDQLEKGLDEGHWESANGDARGFLNAAFEIIADRHPHNCTLDLKEGYARNWLQKIGFFKPEARESENSYEGKFVKALAELLGTDGAHSGTSDGGSAVFRYAVLLLTADYFIERVRNL